MWAVRSVMVQGLRGQEVADHFVTKAEKDGKWDLQAVSTSRAGRSAA